MVRSLLDPPKRTPEAEARLYGRPVRPSEKSIAEWRPWCGMEALYLGEVIVGRVSPSRQGHHRAKTSAIFNLASVESGAFWFACKSVEEAKLEVERRLAEWLRRAGLQ